jgi:hypothetical protein
MITLIWKELRENLKWALLAALVLAGAELYALYQSRNGQFDYYSNIDGITLCKSSFLIATTFGCAAIGFFLGLLQILPELKQDRWAALLHRPVQRGVIFFGKAAAGLILYAMAAVPPFLLCVWLASTPGHFAAPFVPGLVLPGAADTFAGLLYYFAALGVALQGGGRIGVKALPLFAAVHVTCFVVAAVTFSDAVWATAAMAVALCIAAWGVMLHQNSFSGRPWPGRCALLAVVFYGLCGVGDLFRLVFVSEQSQNSSFTNYELSDSGVPLKIHYVNGVVVSVQGLDGNAPQDANYKPDRIRSHVRYLNSCSMYIGDAHGWSRNWSPDSYRSSYGYLWANQPYQYPRLEQWYYLVQQRTIVGMQPDKKTPIGRLDTRGFEPMSAAPAPFAPGVELQVMRADGYCLWDAKSVRFANLAKREITNVALPIPGAVFGAGTAWANGENGVVNVTAIALAEAVAVYDQRNRRLIATLPYHQEMDHWGNLLLGVNGDGDRFYLWYKPSMWIPRKARKGMPSYLEEVNAQGQVLHSYTLPPLPDPQESRTWIDYLTQDLKSPAFFFGRLAYRKAGAALGNNRLRNDLAWDLGENWKVTEETAVSITILSTLLAGMTLWWARRVQFAWRRAWSWAGMAFAFNVAGLMAFRLMADWPRFVPCAACGRNRPIDGERCPHCGAAWPDPEPSGTEIFDSGAGEAEATAGAF